MALPANYWEWYENQMSMSDSMQVTQNLLYSNAKTLKLDTSKTVMSVGAGNGTLDSFLIKKCTPELEHYIGLEPHKPSFDKLSEAMMNFTDIKVSLVNDSVEGWKGPEKSVDLILASHVFYHVEDKVAAARKLYTWIKPGGSIIIVQDHDHGAYNKIGQEIFGVRAFNIHDLKDLLEGEQYCVSDGGTLQYNHHTDSSDEEIIKWNFRYFVKDFAEEQMIQLVTAIKNEYKGSNFETICTIGCICIDKPEA